MYGDYLYWTDWIFRAIYRVNKYTGQELTRLTSDMDSQPMAIAVVSENILSCEYIQVYY